MLLLHTSNSYSLLQDFLPDDNPFPLRPQSSTSTSASTCTNTTIAINSDKRLTSVAGLGCGSNPSLIAGASSHETAANTCSKSSQSSQSNSDCFPSTETLEKLRSFKFVKTSNLKSRSVHTKRPPTGNDQSELTLPPNKRRSICNEDTRCDTPSNSQARRDTTSRINSGPIFKQPSSNLRTSFNSSTSTPTSSQSEGQSSSVGAKVTPNTHQRHTPRGACSITNFTASQPNHYHYNSSDPAAGLPSTPILSNSAPQSSTNIYGGILSTPQRTPNSSQSSTRLTTPQRAVANTVMQTPTRARQTTPLVCTPTGSGIAVPIARASVPLKRKFPGPAGLLPSLVCDMIL